eukprot:jgi/Chrzof1/9571/Cz04g07370.t1
MPSKEGAFSRSRSGQVATATVTVERPDTVVKSTDGTLFSLPRRQASVPVYSKVNSHVVDPATGKRARAGPRRGSRMQGQPRTISFSAVAITAFLGFRIAQMIRRKFFSTPAEAAPEPEMVEADEQQMMPSVHVIPAMLRQALPKLGPASHVKRAAHAHHERRRRVPTARQKMQATGVRQRKQGTLEKWDEAVKRQMHAMAAYQQQHAARQPGLTVQPSPLGSSATSHRVPPLPSMPAKLPFPAQPIIEVAEVASSD